MLPDRATRSLLTLIFAATLIGVFCLRSTASKAEPQCVASFREIKFPDGSARVKNYICKTEGATNPVLRVEFDRLSESAAGSLIMSTRFPDMERAFGKVRLVDNDVAREAKKIFERFGTKSVQDRCYSFLISVAAGGRALESNGGCGEQASVWSLTFPVDASGESVVELPLLSDVRQFQDADVWPKGYHFFYSDCSTDFDPILCTTLWRGARPEDLSEYDRRKAEYDKALGFEVGTEESSPEMDDYLNRDADQRTRYFGLVSYLTADSWPDDFLLVTGQADACGGTVFFQLHVRHFVLDVAFIQNLTERPLGLDDLLGSETAAAGLRRVQTGGRIPANRLSLTQQTLAPGETIAVPLSITFVMEKNFTDAGAARKVYQRIEAAKHGTVFKASGLETPIKKTRESFRPPEPFKAPAYAFGPELRLAGLVADGKPIVLDQASRNFMKLSAVSEEGSCPFLYSWDNAHSNWVQHGKVIHVANNKNKETTDTRTFDGFRSKFRLAEEELEVSYIDHVKLEVELKDGGGMTLTPDFAAMTAKDGRYATIKAGDRIEFSFALPPSLKAEDVKRSTLAVTGYYRRYSDLLMARQ